MESLGRDQHGPRFCVVAGKRLRRTRTLRRFRMFSAVASRVSSCGGARERPAQVAEQSGERSLEPLLPGFVCASAAMNRLADQIQRMQGHNLTVLITGESGTGKDLVARAIHFGVGAQLRDVPLPTTAQRPPRELADSQLFGHRRGSFTGAVADLQGLIRSAAGGTLFLDEIGRFAPRHSAKLLRFLEQARSCPWVKPGPWRLNVRVLAATNADLEQRVSEGKFREDLFYRLSVIRLYVPPLRDRREEVPHLSTFFLRDACERLGKPDVHLSSATLDLFARYWWPGNVRQLRNEIQRAVALSPPGGVIEPDHLSPPTSPRPRRERPPRDRRGERGPPRASRSDPVIWRTRSNASNAI
jgi:DNA-binding NtrC family response regulator